MVMNLVKKKAKRKNFSLVDEAMKDDDLVAESAKGYNLEGSQIYLDVEDLQR